MYYTKVSLTKLDPRIYDTSLLTKNIITLSWRWNYMNEFPKMNILFWCYNKSVIAVSKHFSWDFSNGEKITKITVEIFIHQSLLLPASNFCWARHPTSLEISSWLSGQILIKRENVSQVSEIFPSIIAENLL